MENYGTNNNSNGTATTSDLLAQVEAPPPAANEEEENETNNNNTNTNYGSTVTEASLNLISSTIGAGIIGFGKAIADSGGFMSLISILVVGYLSKLALDLVVTLAVETPNAGGSFEDLAIVAYGQTGKRAVMISKGLFAFGCLVGLIKITQDNLAASLLNLFYHNDDENTSSTFQSLLQNDDMTTIIACTAIMLPLSFLRDVTPLAPVAGVKVVAFAFCVFICMYIAILSFDIQDYVGEGFVDHWLDIKEGYIQSLGTFLFAFVSQHTVHLVFLSLKSEIRTIQHFQTVSTAAVSVSTLIYVLLGMSVYMTFWEKTSSSMFETYPPSKAVDMARILLSISCLLSYPLPFVSCREMIILSLPRNPTSSNAAASSSEEKKGLIIRENSDMSTSSWLLPGSENQLIRSYHEVLTICLYLVSLYMAIKARSLTDILNLVGCATGTVIAFILPGLFSFKLRGYSFFPAFLLVFGGTLGVIGTWLVLRDIIIHPKDDSS